MNTAPIVLSPAKTHILELLSDVSRATIFQTGNKNNVLTPKTKGASTLRGNEKHFKELVELKFIRKVPPIIEKNKGVSRFQYYELTFRGESYVGARNTPKFPISGPKGYEHQCAVQTSVIAIREALGERISVEYEPELKKYGRRIDAIITTESGRVLLVEVERSKGIPDLVKDIRNRYKIVDLKQFPKGTKWYYVINCTKSKNNQKKREDYSIIDPKFIYEKDYSHLKIRTVEFLNDLLPEIKDLPSWDFRFACLHEFEDFGKGIWRAPGKKETFKI